MLYRQHSCTAWRVGSSTALELLTAKRRKVGNPLASFDVYGCVQQCECSQNHFLHHCHMSVFMKWSADNSFAYYTYCNIKISFLSAWEHSCTPGSSSHQSAVSIYDKKNLCTQKQHLMNEMLFCYSIVLLVVPAVSGVTWNTIWDVLNSLTVQEAVIIKCPQQD